MENSAAPRSIAIVTGASRGRGIGAAVCRQLARDGFDIFFTYWGAHDHSLYGAEQAGSDELRAEIEALGVRCACAEFDLGQPDAATRIMDAAEAALGPCAVLVNNAAHDDSSAPFDQLSAVILDRYYAVNMRGPMLLSVEFARRFTGGSGGRIINLTSGQGVGPMPGKLPYIATKGAIEAFTVTLAAEVAPRGITVNAVDPGPTDTGWLSADPALLRSLTERAPFGRVGLPADAARLIAFLASPAAAWITGQIIHSRGGL
ncbi:MAG TPA: SDR family oxidoreductase [Ktedonobacterales bacterium]|nr:SDR family oxidoreductase [Ktedonobacterales bacterium]